MAKGIEKLFGKDVKFLDSKSSNPEIGILVGIDKFGFINIILNGTNLFINKERIDAIEEIVGIDTSSME